MSPRDEQDQDTVITDFEAYRRRAGRAPAQTGGDGGGWGGDLNRRVAALEVAVDKIDSKLDKIIAAQAAERLSNEQRFGFIGERFGPVGERLASIEAKLETKASAAELAEIKGRVNSLPSTWQMAFLIIGTVFTILGGSFLILKFGLPHTPQPKFRDRVMPTCKPLPA